MNIPVLQQQVELFPRVGSDEQVDAAHVVVGADLQPLHRPCDVRAAHLKDANIYYSKTDKSYHIYKLNSNR